MKTPRAAWFVLCFFAAFLTAKASQVVPANSNNVVVSEIMYSPPRPTPIESSVTNDEEEYEFIEILNISSNTVDLTGVEFSDGVDIEFSGLLGPGEYLVAVGNLAAFQARYGTNIRVAGEFSGRLANEGEDILLEDDAGSPIKLFRYDVSGAWPPVQFLNPPGGAIELIVPETNPNPGLASNWRASVSRIGTPGTAPDFDRDGMLDVWEREHFGNLDAEPNDDADGDTLTNLKEFEIQTNPNNLDSDNDSLNDNVETNTGIYVSAQDTGTDPTQSDTDLDNLPDGAETNTGIFVSLENTGTDPLYYDTDRDGYADYREIIAGSDPHDDESMPYPPGIVSFTVSNTTNVVGTPVILTWEVTNAHAVKIEGELMTNSIGTLTLNLPVGFYTYTLSASNGYTTILTSLTFRVFPDAPPEIRSFEVRPAIIGSGGRAKFSWLIDGIADSVSLDHGIGQVTQSHVIVSNPLEIPILSRSNFWRYWDEGTDPGTNWMHLTFDDSTWPTGPGPLGYGDDGLTTWIRSGNGVSQYASAFFRRSFVITNTTGIDRLTLRLMRDDGAQVWLNGQEILRSNLPDGPITHNTLAITHASDDGRIYNEIPINARLLIPGTNILAAGVHQASLVSEDIKFDLELVAETSTFTNVTYTLTASNAAGISTATATLYIRPDIEELVSFFHPWKFDQTGTNHNGRWTNFFFFDGLWSEGFGILGTEDRGPAVPYIQTPLLRPFELPNFSFTTLIRGYFTLSPHISLSEIEALRLTYLVDDGAIVYLNGQELHRIGALSEFSLAMRSVGDTDFEGPFILPATNLVAGTNIVAVELQQVGIETSDIVWGMRLEAITTNSAALEPSFKIEQMHGKVVLQWYVPAHMELQSAPAVSGPWNRVSSIPGQYVTEPDAAAAFYRLFPLPPQTQ